MRFTAAVALLMLPAFAMGAGFAKQTIFLSRSSVTEGEVVLIHAIVANDAQSPFAGTLILRDGEEEIGTVPVSLGAGEAFAGSVSWKPTAGKHTVSAELVDKAGAEQEKMSEDFTIKEKPKPAATTTQSGSGSAAAVQSSAGIQEQIGSFSPAAQSATAPVFGAIDSGRSKAADVLDNQLKLAKAKIGGDVQGAQTEAEEGQLPDTAGGFWLALWTVYFYLLTVLRFLIGNAAIFYPVFALALLYFMFKMFRRFRRP